MLSIRYRDRQFVYLLVLCGIQAACIAIGYWIDHRLVQYQMWQTVEGESCAALGAAIDRWQATAQAQSRPGSDRQTALEPDPWLSPELAALKAHWVVADRDWRVIKHSAGSAEDGPTAGQTLHWIRRPAAIGPDSPYAKGVLMVGRRQAAVIAPLAASAAHLVAYRAVDDCLVPLSAVSRWLPTAGLISLVWTCGLLSIATFVVATPFFRRLAINREAVEAETVRRIQSLVRTRDAVIYGLAKLTESRDDSTGHHLDRVCGYSTCLAKALARHPKFRRSVTREFIKLIEVTAALHDIGKVGVEDRILLKPGRLSEPERKKMQQHTTIGETCLAEIERRLGPCEFLQMARDIVLFHQERWDGTGYPKGLVAERIPLAARIVAIADAYDALATERVYKPACPHAQCVEIIRGEAGKQFDPDLVRVFLDVERVFCEIARRYAADSSLADGPQPRNSSGELLPCNES